jgi:hypothetical protein
MAWENYTAIGPLSRLFGGGKNPADAAMPYFNQVPGTMSPFYEPYINAGNRALPNLENTYNQMLSDPNAIISRLGAGYTKSPGYDWRLGQGEKAINQAQAAGGMAGSPQHQQLAGQYAENMAGDDYNNYLNQVLGLFGGGVSGMSGLNTQGFQASNELAQSLANNLMTQGQLKYQGQAGQNQQRSQNMSNLFGGLGALAGFLF